MNVIMGGVIYDDLISDDEFKFHQGNLLLIRTWILLDIQSTFYVVCNQRLLKNIRNSYGYITIHCNVGSKWVEMIGYLPGYRTLWFDGLPISNVLSLYGANFHFYMYLYNWNVNHFSLSNPSQMVVFQQIQLGLYYLDIDHRSIMLVNTVAENRQEFTKCKFEGAQAARRSLRMIGSPSERDCISMVRSNLIRNIYWHYQL